MGELEQVALIEQAQLQGAAFGEMSGRKLLLDRALSLEQPVHRRVQIEYAVDVHGYAVPKCRMARTGSGLQKVMPRDYLLRA